MQLRALGQGGLRVSPVSLGCFTYGDTDERELLSVLDRALELGVIWPPSWMGWGHGRRIGR